MSLSTVMSRNGRDQRNLKAASKISARVRSNRPIVCVGSGLKTTPETDNFADIMSEHTDNMSNYQGTRQLTTLRRTQIGQGQTLRTPSTTLHLVTGFDPNLTSTTLITCHHIGLARGNKY